MSPVPLEIAVQLRCLRVFVDQSVEDLPAADPRGGEVDDGWPGVRGVGWALAAALVRPVLVVATRKSHVVSELVEEVRRMSKA